MRTEAKVNVEKAQYYNKLYVNRKRRNPYNYGIRDYVMIMNFDFTPGVSLKSPPRFKGPYVIRKRQICSRRPYFDNCNDKICRICKKL